MDYLFSLFGDDPEISLGEENTFGREHLIKYGMEWISVDDEKPSLNCPCIDEYGNMPTIPIGILSIINENGEKEYYDAQKYERYLEDKDAGKNNYIIPNKILYWLPLPKNTMDLLRDTAFGKMKKVMKK